MKLSELMSGVTPDPEYEGWVTNDDFVFAIDMDPGASAPTDVDDYGVLKVWMPSSIRSLWIKPISGPASLPREPGRREALRSAAIGILVTRFRIICSVTKSNMAPETRSLPIMYISTS